MKKIISVLLSALMLFSLCSVAASAEGSAAVTVAVVDDIHYNDNAKVRRYNSVDEDFAHIEGSGRLYYEANAVFDAFLTEVASSDCDYILIPGDITDEGSAEEVACVTTILSEFEAATGKKVFVVPGNHDVLKTSKSQFMKDYAAFGYNEALEIDTKSASYVVDLNDEYRLIAIDSTTEGNGNHSIFDERLQWISEQGEKAKADGKKLIAMQHQNLLDHMILAQLIRPNAVVAANNEPALSVYAEAGIKYVLTGHSHDHDVASYTLDNGAVIYDIVTGSLSGIGTPYRIITFADDVKIETKAIEKVDTSLFPEGISENAKALAESNFPEYQEIGTDLSYKILFNSYTKASTFKSLLKLEDKEMNAIIDKVGNRLNYALNMPFEKENEVVPGDSIESFVEKYNTTIPDTDYENMIDLGVTIYQASNYGDENFPAYSDELILATRGIAAVLGYALSEVSGEEYAKVLSFISGLLVVELPVDFLKYAGDGVKRFEGIEILVATVILPLIADFSTDNAPADRNVTLPGYDELVENKEVSFLEKILNFFKMIYATARTIFAFLPEWK